MPRWAPILIFLLLPGLQSPGRADPPLDLPTYDTTAETTYRLIGWDDFKGRKATKPRWARGDNWAHIVTALRIGAFEIACQAREERWLCSPGELTPHAVMDKLLSRVGRDAKAKALLAHEQAHFTIAEAAARVLRASLLGIIGEGDSAAAARFDLERKLESARRTIERQLGARQALYDQETQHGVIKKAQKRWQAKAEELLKQATTELHRALAASAEETPEPPAP